LAGGAAIVTLPPSSSFGGYRRLLTDNKESVGPFPLGLLAQSRVENDLGKGTPEELQQVAAI